MMYRKIVSKFKTDYKKIKHNTLLVEELEKVLLILEN
jgi:mRNA-degrading endonuclease YafQ of YafQ-DinJ toxin-antitoxin module